MLLIKVTYPTFASIYVAVKMGYYHFKSTDETGKTLHDHFWWQIYKLDTLLYIMYSCYSVEQNILNLKTEVEIDLCN